jgi:hypothetical protein
LDLICGDDEDCELTKSVKRGDVHVRAELDDILDDMRAGDFTAFADLFDYFFLDDGVLEGWFVDAYEFMYTEVIRRLFQGIINIMFQIPCLNFDSIGCFLASMLDCILIIDLEVCLECHDACDPGCADSETCPDECLPYAASCCPDDDADVMECVETECRSELDGLIAIFECFGRILLNIVGMIVCPLMDFLLVFLDLIVVVFHIIEQVFETINDFFEDELDTVFDALENFCDIIIRPDFNFDLPGPGGGIDIDLDFDIPGDDDDNTLCSPFDLNTDLGDVFLDPFATL